MNCELTKSYVTYSFRSPGLGGGLGSVGFREPPRGAGDCAENVFGGPEDILKKVTVTTRCKRS